MEMQLLLDEYKLDKPVKYYNLCIDQKRNGNIKKSIELFQQMPFQHRVDMIQTMMQAELWNKQKDNALFFLSHLKPSK